MSDQKKEQILFQDLPLDCWCQMITFCRSVKDFFSLCLVVKNLLAYVKQNPFCTRSIEFRIYKLPRSIIHHVTNLKIANGKEKLPTYLKTIHCTRYIQVLQQIKIWFPNTTSVKIALKPTYEEKERKPSIDVDSEFILSTPSLGNRTFLHLRDLRLFLPMSHLTIDLDLPNLENLLVCELEYVERPPHTLVINWLKIRKLRKFTCFGWNLDVSFPGLSDDELHSVLLEDTRTTETNQDFHLNRLANVKTLSISQRSLPWFQNCMESFNGMKKLETLKLFHSLFHGSKSTRALVFKEFGAFGVVPQLVLNKNMNIESFLNLRTLELRLDCVFYPRTKNSEDSMRIGNLPKLESMILWYLEFPIKLFTFPRLKRFECVSCEVIQFVHGENVFPVIEEIEINASHSPNFLHDEGVLKRFKELVEYSYVYCYETDAIEKVDLIGGTKIETLIIVSAYSLHVKTVQNCPNLRALGMIPTNDMVLKTLPKLKHLIIGKDEDFSNDPTEQIPNFENLMIQIGCNSGIEYLVFREYYRFFGHPFSAVLLKNIKKLEIQMNDFFEELPYETRKETIFFDGERTTLLEIFVGVGPSSLVLSNHPRLNSVVYTIDQESMRGTGLMLHMSVQLTNCPSLKNVELKGWVRINEEEQCLDEPENLRKNELVLKNLEGLEEMKRLKDFYYLDRFETIGCPNISELHIEFVGLNFKKGWDETREIELDGKNRYPKLHTIIVIDNAVRGFAKSLFTRRKKIWPKRKMVIGSLSNMESLRTIKLAGNMFVYVSFVKKITGLDSKKVMLEIPEKVKEEHSRMKGVHTLYDYCQILDVQSQ